MAVKYICESDICEKEYSHPKELGRIRFELVHPDYHQMGSKEGRKKNRPKIYKFESPSLCPECIKWWIGEKPAVDIPEELSAIIAVGIRAGFLKRVEKYGT